MIDTDIGIFGFETDDQDEAIAALLIYAVYRSRDIRKFKVTPDMWGLICREAKSAAKRSRTLGEWVEDFKKPPIHCSTISPKWIAVGIAGEIVLTPIQGGGFIQLADRGERQELLPAILRRTDHKKVIRKLYRETEMMVELARGRTIREKPIEARFGREIEADDLPDDVLDLEEVGRWMRA